MWGLQGTTPVRHTDNKERLSLKGNDFNLRHKGRTDTVSYGIGKLFLSLQNIPNSDKLSVSIPANDKYASGSVGKGDKCLHNRFQGGNVPLKFEGFSFMLGNK